MVVTNSAPPPSPGPYLMSGASDGEGGMSHAVHVARGMSHISKQQQESCEKHHATAASAMARACDVAYARIRIALRAGMAERGC